MTTPPASPATGPGADPGTGRGLPGWVKVFFAVGAIVILLLAGLLVFGGDRHGPMRHLPANGGGHTPPADMHNPR